MNASAVRLVKRIAAALLAVIFLYSSWKMAHKMYDYHRGDRLYADLSKQYASFSVPDSVPDSAPDAAAPPDIPLPSAAAAPGDERADDRPTVAYPIPEQQKAIMAEQSNAQAELAEQRQLEINPFGQSPSLLKLNRDTVGWIKIPHTRIDYPIVQTTDNDYYLTHDFAKKSDSVGSIFMDYRNQSGFTDRNTILYGHNMKNKSMFHDLAQYKDQAFFDDHPIIYIYTPKEVQKWEVFLVYVAPADFDYLVRDFSSASAFQQYIAAIWRKAYHTKDISLSGKDRILTLSTCSYEFDEARTVVAARLIS